MKEVTSLAALKAVFTEGWGNYIARIFWADGTLNTHHQFLSSATDLTWPKEQIAADPVGALKTRYDAVWAVKLGDTIVAAAHSSRQDCILLFAITADGTAYFVTDTTPEPELLLRHPKTMRSDGHITSRKD